MLTPERTCYDVTYYHLDVRIDPQAHTIRGSNTILFKVVTAFDRMQVDLFKNMSIEKITLDGKGSLAFTREYNAFFIQLPSVLQQNTEHEIVVFYSGEPTEARRPPWEGGFSWQKDKEGNPWVVVTCQGTGASLWWPNKDHQSDEARQHVDQYYRTEWTAGYFQRPPPRCHPSA
jgi:aminopeptidase N